MNLGLIAGMKLTSLLLCAEDAALSVLKRVLEELGIEVELCSEPVRTAVRLAQDHFDLMILDCEKQSDVMNLLQECRSTNANETSLAVVVVAGQESIRDMFTLGVNFVLYKPVSYERALSTLRAAQAVLFRDNRRNARASVHTQAMIDYAGVEQARATLVDLAEDGMGVNFGKTLPPTCKVYFQFQLPGQTATVRLSGQVIWQDWSGRAGIQFVDVPKSSRRVLSEWLQSNLADAARMALASQPVEVEHSAQPSEDLVVADGPSTEKYRASKPAGIKSQSRDGNALARLRAEPANRRGQTRYACRLGAEVYKQGSSVRNYCHLSDLSPGGCYLEMPLAFPAGTLVEITVRTYDIKLRLSGLVKSSHPGYGMGVSFQLNTKDERHGVQQLIDFVAASAEKQ